LQRGVDGVARIAEVSVCSAVYESAPVGPPQGDYLNAALRAEADLEPEALLDELLLIERQCGRERRVRWGPRTLDLDLLWIDGVRVETPRLTVPHPDLARRPFAILPLLDVAPGAVDPGTGLAYRALLEGIESAAVSRRDHLVLSPSRGS
jgi:2-amino-4-hydroxy-6-hydroxymethyldihydropteridine diphosphokinase